MHIQFLVEKEEEGYSAKADGYPIFTQGDTFEELNSNAKEALNCFFEKPFEGSMDLTVRQKVG